MDLSDVILRKSNRRSGAAQPSGSSSSPAPTLAVTQGQGFGANEMMQAMGMAMQSMQAMMQHFGGQQGTHVQTVPPTRRVKAILGPTADTAESTRAVEPERIDKSPMDAPPKAPLALEDARPREPAVLDIARPEPPPAEPQAPASGSQEQKDVDDEFHPDNLHQTFKKPAGAKSALAKSAPKAKPKAQPSKPSSNSKPKASPKTVVKPTVKKKSSGGWVVESRFRSTGQVDKHYVAPNGVSYRILKEARKAGFRE